MSRDLTPDEKSQLTRLVYSLNGLDAAGIRQIAESCSYEVVKAACDHHATRTLNRAVYEKVAEEKRQELLTKSSNSEVERLREQLAQQARDHAERETARENQQAARERRKTALEWLREFLILFIGIMIGHFWK